MIRMDNIWRYRCPDEGQWMAFYDGEGRAAEREMLGEHLRGCASCQTLFEEISENAAFALSAFDVALPSHSRRSWSLMKKMWIPAAAALVLVGLGTGFHTLGQNVEAAFASLFQVKSIGTVPVTPQQIAALSRVVTQGGKVTLAHYGSIKVAGPMQETQVPLSGLSRYGMPNLWPASLGAPGLANVQTGIMVTLRLNVPHINSLIASQGGHDLFPASLNGVPFTLSVPAAASIHNGAWTLDEAPQPTLAAPGSVPVKQVAQALENLPFLPPQLQTAVAAMANWKNTLIVPLPGHPQTVTVAGTQGIVDANAGGTTAGEAWVEKDGLVVAISEHQSTPINQTQFQQRVARLFP